jgi:hypothetical protein
MPQLEPEVLQIWLEWAGQRLLALPSHKLKPQEPRALWPDYAQDKWELVSFRKEINLRAPTPPAEDITWMDKILLLPNLCPELNQRRMLHFRLLVHPLNNNYLYKWSKLAQAFHTSNYLVKSWHQKGLKSVCCKIPRDEVRTIRGFFADPH